MTEAQWWKSKDGDAMLAVVTDRLSERKLALLACGLVRRVADLLPNAPYHLAVDFVEVNGGPGEKATVRDVWRRMLDVALPTAQEAARARQRGVVVGCDPDSPGEEFQATEGRHTHPAVPLFQAASRNAASAVAAAAEAVRAAHLAVRAMYDEWRSQFDEGGWHLDTIRQHAHDAQVQAAEAGVSASLALELKDVADRMADSGPPRNAGVKLSGATETAQRMEEYAGYKIDRLADQKTRGDQAALAKLIREQVGNPYRAYRLEPSWRTETVLALARAIEAERAFDRMPILADALMDADCDEEAILRHCRSLEKHASEPPHHARGCWVLDLILEREPGLFAAPPVESRPRPQGRTQRMGPFRPRPEGMA